jgi:hypothetical protein
MAAAVHRLGNGSRHPGTPALMRSHAAWPKLRMPEVSSDGVRWGVAAAPGPASRSLSLSMLVTQILAEPPGGLTTIGLNSCLTAVNARAVQPLVMPVGGLIPGFACEACGTLATLPAAMGPRPAIPSPICSRRW